MILDFSPKSLTTEYSCNLIKKILSFFLFIEFLSIKKIFPLSVFKTSTHWYSADNVLKDNTKKKQRNINNLFIYNRGRSVSRPLINNIQNITLFQKLRVKLRVVFCSFCRFLDFQLMLFNIYKSFYKCIIFK